MSKIGEWMRNLFQSTAAWVGLKINSKSKEVEPALQSEVQNLEAAPPAVVDVPPIESKSVEQVEVAVVLAESPQPPPHMKAEPIVPPPVIELTAPPEPVVEVPSLPLTLKTRGSKQYAVCPHCEAMWSIRERLTHPSFKRSARGLTCPACDKPVTLPEGIDPRRLS